MKIVSRIPLYGALLAVAACGGTSDALDDSRAAAPGTETAESGAALEASPDYTFRVVAQAGDAAPGGGQVYWSFHADEINEKGDVVFSTWLTSGGAGFFRTRDGALELLGRTGAAAPGGVTFGSQHDWYSGGLNTAGDSSFSFYVAGTPTNTPLGGRVGVFRVDEKGNKTAIVLPNTTIAPNGKPFRGAYMRTSMNSHADVVFSGMIDTDHGIHQPGETYLGKGFGVFLADGDNVIHSLVSPGDPAPGGGTFDFAQNPYINERGDVAFGGHVAGEECRTLGTTQAQRLFCAESVYLRDKRGAITSIAHQDEPAPGGGTFRIAFGPVVNNRGDVLFTGDITPAPGFFQQLGVFLHRGGETVAVALPGDAMPGGGHLVSTSGRVSSYDVNDHGEVVFQGVLDTDDDQDGNPDTAVYAWKDGVVRLVVRSARELEGLGMVGWVANYWGHGIATNNAGQVVVPVALADGNRALVVATPAL